MMPLGLRRAARTIRRELSVFKYRLLHALGTRTPAKVVPMPTRDSDLPLTHPAVGIVAPPGITDEHLRELLAQQTESSWTLSPDPVDTTPWLWCPGSGVEDLEACHLESLLLTTAALDLNMALGGWAAPGGAIGRPDGLDPGNLTLLRRPVAEAENGPIHGALVPQITQATPETPVVPPTQSSGSFILNHQGGPGAVIRLPVHNAHDRLAAIPTEKGASSVLFLAPYLAVGGAENLLFDLIEGLTRTSHQCSTAAADPQHPAALSHLGVLNGLSSTPPRPSDRKLHWAQHLGALATKTGEKYGLNPEHRVLVVTLDPHQDKLGQTVDRCRRLTPHVYTLGDWVPREARIGTLSHLIRRWQVEVLVSWNGTVDFYDHALELKQQFPDLRILAQLYNHEGGWIDRTTSTLLKELHGHLGVNERISRALVDKGASPDQVHTVHHGVRVPPPMSDEDRIHRRRVKRAELGLPEEAVVVGTFIRLHRQKRPLDIVRLARKLEQSGFHFLLVGGGPETDAVEAEIQRDPPDNLLRLPLQTEAVHLYDALDLCLMTSEYEGLPVFLLDGLAREIPCVATAVGEIPELLHDGGGILVETPGDLDALADALLSLKDPERRQSEGQRGRRTVEDRFGLQTYVETYRRLLFPGDSR
ncbi:MAG: glycosyltransferase [Acidobacteriota bacterium]